MSCFNATSVNLVRTCRAAVFLLLNMVLSVVAVGAGFHSQQAVKVCCDGLALTRKHCHTDCPRQSVGEFRRQQGGLPSRIAGVNSTGKRIFFCPLPTAKIPQGRGKGSCPQQATPCISIGLIFSGLPAFPPVWRPFPRNFWFVLPVVLCNVAPTFRNVGVLCHFSSCLTTARGF
jgi:hypothetical protein